MNAGVDRPRPSGVRRLIHAIVDWGLDRATIADRSVRPDPTDASGVDPIGVVRLVTTTVPVAAIAGAIMGMYGGVGPDRVAQITYTAIKLPILVLGTGVVCFPVFIALNVILGLAGDLRDSARAIVRTQTAIATIHASLMPIVGFWYLIDRNHGMAVLVNAAALGAASLVGQVVLRRTYRPLIARDATHGRLMWFWLVIYGFVGVQLAWVLRPYVGNPGLETEFLRAESWSNAYLAVWDHVRVAFDR